MKQHEIKIERVLNGNTFFIRPFSAFTSANLSGEVTALIVPIIGSLAPALSGAVKSEDVDLMDVDVETIAPALASGMSSVSGDKLEKLLKKLLVQNRNISVQLEGENEAQVLTEDLANDVFCGEAQDMFILAIDVIKANYNGFFKKLGGQFGGLLNTFLQKV